MADLLYTVNQDLPENIEGFEQFSEEDKALVSSFQINNTFDPTKNFSELHILSLSDEILESNYSYKGYTQLGNAQSAGQDGASILTIDPISDSRVYGYENGGVKLLYHFLDDLYTSDNSSVDFYIQDISQDRTEISLSNLSITPENLVTVTSAIRDNIQNQSYFTGFRLNFKNNDLFIATNIDTLDVNGEKVVVVKLYEPLPTSYRVKSKLSIVDIISDSIVYEVDSEFILQAEPAPTLRSANFNIDLAEQNVLPTEYFNYNELFSYPVNNSNSQIYSIVNEKSIDISVDYSNYNDFVHFSSAQERLLNFKYKLDLVNTYSENIASISLATTGLQGISGSKSYYENLLTGVVSNFDHYERFLYYESGSTSWPKSNTTKPYVNKLSNTAEAITWYSNQVANAIDYDNTNYSSLAYSIPTYLRDDANNENYLTFVYMVGQHFDNLWLYSKAVTDKYDADNRIDKGISKDLVAEALKNFGVKLYTSNKSTEDLFSTFIGQAYQTGSEKLNYYVTGSLTGSNESIQPSSFDNYQKEVQKRIYHNLPLLLKSKGTERGLRALINCLGIPGDILDIKLYGGVNTQERPFFGDYQNYTSSLDKIRIDNTGSIVDGNTLSNSTSIIKRDKKYTDDLHVIEVGFSPTDNVDNYIISKSLADPNLTTFNIDNYIGNPSSLTLPNYDGLYTVAKGILGDLSQYDVRDYVRLIKFFDNTVFKMVKDFIPARTVADTGIIIKPNLLNRSKAKSVKASVDTILSASMDNAFNYTSSIDTAFTEGKHGNSFGAASEYTASYVSIISTPQGLRGSNIRQREEAKFDGEFSNSSIIISTGELNSSNLLKKAVPPKVQFNVVFYTTAPAIQCTLDSTAITNVVVQSGVPVALGPIFAGAGFTAPNNTQYYLGGNNTGPLISNPYSFTGTQYQEISIYADAGVIAGNSCYETVKFTIIDCQLGGVTAPPTITAGTSYNLYNWFTLGVNLDVRFEIEQNNAPAVHIESPQAYIFPGAQGDTFKVRVLDKNNPRCKAETTVAYLYCSIRPGEGTVLEFESITTFIDLTEDLFRGNLPAASYYTQRATQASIPDPELWELDPAPTSFENLTTTNPYWVKVVNAPNCDRTVKIVKIASLNVVRTISLRYDTGNNDIAPNKACWGYRDKNIIVPPKTQVYYYTSTSNQALTFDQLVAGGYKLTYLVNGVYTPAYGSISNRNKVIPYYNGYPTTTSNSYICTDYEVLDFGYAPPTEQR